MTQATRLLLLAYLRQLVCPLVPIINAHRLVGGSDFALDEKFGRRVLLDSITQRMVQSVDFRLELMLLDDGFGRQVHL